MLHVLLSLPTVFVGLALLEGSSPDDVGIDREVGEIGDASGDFLTLVVASFLLAILSQRDGDDAVDVIEEVDSHAFLRQEFAHVGGYLRTIVVLQLVEDVADEGMPLVIEEGASLLDGYLMPKHLSHLVVVRLLPGIGTRKMEIARETDAFFLAHQSVAADGAEARKEQVDDFG